jgi:hypothetical protein
MPIVFADSEDGVVLAADGIDPMLRWNGYDPQFDDAGVAPPTDTPAAVGSGSGTLTGTYVCFMRYVDAQGNYSNPTPFSATFTLTANLQVDYSNLQAPSDPSVVRRQILRNSDGQATTFYVDIDTTDVGSSALSSTRTDDDLVTQEAQPLFASDGSTLYDRFAVPPDTVSVIAPHLGRVWGVGVADYAEGSVAVTNGSTAVTGTMVDWRVGFAGRFLHVGGADKPYEIASVDRAAGTLVLLDAYDGPTNPFASYTIRPDPTLTQQVSFSEAGRPESWPPDNALTLREDGDRPTAIILCGSFLYVAKRRSLTKITAQGEPKDDAYLYDSAKRGCASARAWTRVEALAYVLDEQGAYRFDGREAEPISSRIQDFFRGNNRFGLRINWKCARFFHALHCPLEETVRFFVTLNGAYLPRYALCYGTKADKWWIEEYPFPVGASTLGRIGRTTGGWGATSDAPFAAGRASRVWVFDGVARRRAELAARLLGRVPGRRAGDDHPARGAGRRHRRRPGVDRQRPGPRPDAGDRGGAGRRGDRGRPAVEGPAGRRRPVRGRHRGVPDADAPARIRALRGGRRVHGRRRVRAGAVGRGAGPPVQRPQHRPGQARKRPRPGRGRRDGRRQGRPRADDPPAERAGPGLRAGQPPPRSVHLRGDDGRDRAGRALRADPAHIQQAGGQRDGRVMSLFDANRLRREDHWTADDLSEEVYAILDAASVKGLNGPLPIRVDGNQPAITLQMPPGITAPPITVTVGDTTYQIPMIPYTPVPPTVPGLPAPPPSPPPVGSDVIPDITVSGGTTPSPQQAIPPGFPFTTLGKVVSGSGNDYQVGIWLGDPGAAGDAPFFGIFPAKVIQLDSGEDVPDGTTVYATCFYKRFSTRGPIGLVVYFQPAVWLDD